MVEVVRFPHLPSHPSAEDSDATTTSSAAALSSSDGGGRGGAPSPLSSASSSSSRGSDDDGRGKRPASPSSSSSSSSDDDAMLLDDVDPSERDDAAEARIRTSLLALVAALKRRKEGGEERTNLPRGGATGEGKERPPRPIAVVMGWMDRFQDHERIQLLCLQSLPIILEDPPSRLSAQKDGLASVVLYDMAAFPDHALLQLTAFHTLVVLLRPLGTNEGTVHKANVREGRAAGQNAQGMRSTGCSGSGSGSGSGSSGGRKKQSSSPPSSRRKGSINAHPLIDASCEPRWEENGVRVMLDSLRRFANDRYLQAMGCWAMVNAALYPTLKASLLRLGGVYAVTNAMMLHPNVEAVQFRGLFALINLVIPDNKHKKDGDGSSIRAHVYQIARLTILAMRNFHSNKSILNRGCLVLRNLSLTPAYVRILARTPGCLDLLSHCRQACPRDALVQRSARTVAILVRRAAGAGKDDGAKDELGRKDAWKVTRPLPVGGGGTGSAATGAKTPEA